MREDNNSLLNPHAINDDRPHRRRRYQSTITYTIEYFSCCCSKTQRIYLSPSTSLNFTLISTLFLFFIPSALFYIFILPSFSPFILLLPSSIASSLIFIAMLYCYFDIVTTPPGYVETSNQITLKEYEELNPRKVIKETEYILPYCETCQIVRDVRVFHCKKCNKCIQRHDHHCEFVNNCVGKNNHCKFLKFIIFAAMHSTFIAVYCILYIVKQLQLTDTFFNTPADIICVVILVIALLISLTMIFFVIQHLVLISNNVTTSESIRKKYKHDAFDRGCSANWKEMIYHI